MDSDKSGQIVLVEYEPKYPSFWSKGFYLLEDQNVIFTVMNNKDTAVAEIINGQIKPLSKDKTHELIGMYDQHGLLISRYFNIDLDFYSHNIGQIQDVYDPNLNIEDNLTSCLPMEMQFEIFKNLNRETLIQLASANTELYLSVKYFLDTYTCKICLTFNVHNYTKIRMCKECYNRAIKFACEDIIQQRGFLRPLTTACNSQITWACINVLKLYIRENDEWTARISDSMNTEGIHFYCNYHSNKHYYARMIKIDTDEVLKI